MCVYCVARRQRCHGPKCAFRTQLSDHMCATTQGTSRQPAGALRKRGTANFLHPCSGRGCLIIRERLQTGTCEAAKGAKKKALVRPIATSGTHHRVYFNLFSDSLGKVILRSSRRYCPTHFIHLLPRVYACLTPRHGGGCTLSVDLGVLRSFSHNFRSP